jgi:hypothetical protein
MAHWWGGDMAEAEPLTRAGLNASLRALGERDPITLQFMQAHLFTIACLAQEPWTDVEQRFSKALELHRAVLGPGHPRTLRLVYGVALSHASQFHAAPGGRELSAAFELGRALGKDHPLLMSLTALLAHVHLGFHEFDQAADLASEARRGREKTLGPDHPLTLTSIVIEAHVQVAQGRLDEAEPITRDILDLSRNVAVENSPFLAWQMAVLGWAYLEKGAIEQAETFIHLALQAVEQRPKANPLATLGIRIKAGALRLAQHRNVEAEELLRAAYLQAVQCWPESGYQYYLMSLRGESLVRRAEYAAAEPLLLEAHQGLERHRATMLPYLNPSRRIEETTERLARLYEAWGRPAQASRWIGQR